MEQNVLKGGSFVTVPDKSRIDLSDETLKVVPIKELNDALNRFKDEARIIKDFIDKIEKIGEDVILVNITL